MSPFPDLLGTMLWRPLRPSLLRAVVGACLCLSAFDSIVGQDASVVHGHVYHAGYLTPCTSAAIQAWPCGKTVFADDLGHFAVACSAAIDSLSVMSHGHEAAVVVVNGRTHVDIELEALHVALSSAEVSSAGAEDEPEGILAENAGDVLSTLESVSGLRGLDLGAGLIQPVFRGLMGARVAVLEDGVPQAGGRWGADHGLLVDAALYDGVEAVPGGGHVWLGPESMGGALRLAPMGLLESDGTRTQSGIRYRAGDGAGRFYVLHRSRKGQVQWHSGWSISRHGNRNVAQSSFEYIGRQFDLAAPRLPNTSGRGMHGVVGLRLTGKSGDWGTLECRWGRVHQGLFPGIVGVPDQSDLEQDVDAHQWNLPLQQAGRMQLQGKWRHMGRRLRTLRLSISRHNRRELAPPHAHGFGPEPEGDLSLSLGEFHVFGEGKWEGSQGAFGIQFEGLNGQTSGWEFLLPNHSRQRASFIGERVHGQDRVGVRLDAVHNAHEAHAEPLYAPDGSEVGVDVRTTATSRWFPGGAINWYHPMVLNPHLRGSWTVAFHSRAPSSYALAANGIHHGTFRFEQGNPDLRPEQSVEFRMQMMQLSKAPERDFSWNVRGFCALHKGFIHLTPLAAFAPIAHAGQVYAFQAKDAFRTGLEAAWTWSSQTVRFENSIALLGQWALETGLGLPFTAPADVRSSVGRMWGENGRMALTHRWIAAARLTARNESVTPAASLWGVQLGWKWSGCALEFEVHNLMNVAWLDHVSAYRALGLVAQGRWASLQFSLNVRGGDAGRSPQQQQQQF